MKRATDTLARQWELLQLIPREPRRVSAPELRERLAAGGYDVDVRTIQRDLATLETKFMLRCEPEGRTNRWYFGRQQPPLQIPAMSETTAITLLLVRDYLLPILPSVVTDELTQYFEKARARLDGTRFATWASRTRILQRGPVLSSPAVAAAVRDAVYGALLEGTQLEVQYRNREADEPAAMTVHPLALVAKDGVLYLVATIGDYEDPRQLALHRMASAAPLDAPARASSAFSLREYVDEDGFAYRVSSEELELTALFDPGAARHLLERKLSPNQKACVAGDGRVRVEAKVADTQELRWWLLGFGAQVEVVKPAALRREMSEIAGSMAQRYAAEAKS